MDVHLAVVLALAAAAGPIPSPSPDGQDVVAETDRMSAREYDERTRMSRTFPNELWRLYGADAAAKGNFGDAVRHFRHAARYGDKYSQHRISLMYWHGAGVEVDRALAYAWADLAAERMYPSFVVLREKMWMTMQPAERERALRAGQALYDEFGDETAKPRLARAIENSTRDITGSRTGFYDERLQVVGTSRGRGIGGDLGNFDLTPMYADWRRDPHRYWAAEDAVWSHGNVEVGEVRRADER
jgi:hypothetical protein